MLIKIFLTVLLFTLTSAQDDDTVEDFKTLMHESSDELLAGLSQEELRKKLKVILEDIDSDDDNIIEGDELKRWVEDAEKKVTRAEAVSELSELDKDGDKTISWDEYEAANGDDNQDEMEFAKKLFELADENDDGELTLKEYIKFSNPEDDDELRPLMVMRVLKKLDEDGDGKLSYDEVDGFVKTEKVFDEDDENDDGFLDTEEIDEILDDDFEDEELEALFKKLKRADDDDNGELSIEEILEEEHLLRHTPILNLGLRIKYNAKKDEL